MRKSLLLICLLSLVLLRQHGFAQEKVNLVFLGRDGTYEAAMKVAIAAYERLHPT